MKLEFAKLEVERRTSDNMPENNHSQTETPPPHAQLIQMALAYCTSRIVYIAAKLGLADHLAEGPKTADALAGATGTHAPSLYRAHANSREPRILTEDATAPICPDATRRGSQDSCTRLSTCDDLDIGRRLDVARMGADALFGSDRKERL